MVKVFGDNKPAEKDPEPFVIDSAVFSDIVDPKTLHDGKLSDQLPPDKVYEIGERSLKLLGFI